eukprot:8253573-Pyramimonas_sp.AAC.1
MPESSTSPATPLSVRCPTGEFGSRGGEFGSWRAELGSRGGQLESWGVKFRSRGDELGSRGGKFRRPKGLNSDCRPCTHQGAQYIKGVAWFASLHRLPTTARTTVLFKIPRSVHSRAFRAGLVSRTYPYWARLLQGRSGGGELGSRGIDPEGVDSSNLGVIRVIHEALHPHAAQGAQHEDEYGGGQRAEEVPRGGLVACSLQHRLRAPYIYMTMKNS